MSLDFGDLEWWNGGMKMLLAEESIGVDWAALETIGGYAWAAACIGGAIFTVYRYWPRIQAAAKRESAARAGRRMRESQRAQEMQHLRQSQAPVRRMCQLVAQMRLVDFCMRGLMWTALIGVPILLLCPPWLELRQPYRGPALERGVGMAFWWDRPASALPVRLDMARWLAQLCGWVAAAFVLLIVLSAVSRGLSRKLEILTGQNPEIIFPEIETQAAESIRSLYRNS